MDTPAEAVRNGDAPTPTRYLDAATSQTLYARFGDTSSGIVGHLPASSREPVVYTPTPCPRPVTYWDDARACFVEAECVWDGVATGSIDVSLGEGPHRRRWDVSLAGPWPCITY